MKRIITLLIFFATSWVAYSQDTLIVTPGNGQVDGSFIKPYTNSWEVFLIDTLGNENHIRYWTDYVHFIDIDGISYMHRVQDIYNASRDLQTTWVNVVDKKNLIPLRFTVHSPLGNLATMQFEEGSIFLGSNQNEERVFEKDTIEVENKLFDWNLYGMLLIGLPFNEGITYKLPYWSMQTRTKQYIFVTIGNEEVIETLNGKKIKTNSVLTSDGFVFSLTKEAPYVIRLIWNLPNGSKMIWKKI